MSKKAKRNIFILIFFLFCIPILTTSLFDEEQRKINEKNFREKLNAEKNFLMGKFDPETMPGFTIVPSEYLDTKKNNGKIYLREEALLAFLKMRKAAERDGVNLKIVSATRNFNYQKNIWENKWTGATLVDGKNLSESIPDEKTRFRKILEYSAVPGTSRHHLGTDIDVNDTSVAYFQTEKGDTVYDWLSANASKYGFCQPYNEKSARESGYNEERWHWSYKPLSKKYTKEYAEIVKEEDINGFLGDKFVPTFDLINNYVLSVNSDCLN